MNRIVNMNEEEDPNFAINRGTGTGSYSPAIGRRTPRKLKRTVSSPLLISPLNVDLPPLVGAPEDPTLSRYSNQDKNFPRTAATPTTSPESPTITRRGRQLKPLLIRQGSEPQLSQRLSELKIKPSPPDGDINSPRSNGSSSCNSPRIIRTSRTFSRSVDNSPATVRKTFPGATTSGMSPISPPSPSPLIANSETPFASTPNSPFMGKRGTSVKLRRPLARPNAQDTTPSPGHETKRYSLPINLTDSYSPPKNGMPRHVASDDVHETAEQSQHLQSFASETAASVIRTIDDETGEPITVHAIVDSRLARVRHHSGPGDGSSSHSGGASLEDAHSGYQVTNQSGDMLYDIEETYDEVQHDSHTETNNRLECPANSVHERDDTDDDLPDYQKTPLSTNNRVTQWLQGLQPSSDDNTAERILLPDIHDIGGLS